MAQDPLTLPHNDPKVATALVQADHLALTKFAELPAAPLRGSVWQVSA